MDNTQMTQPLNSLVKHVAELLKKTNTRVVFAESCTAGLVSASLGRIPGISEFHCGSAVVYRLDTKTRWLGVNAAILISPGPVSDEVARAMALGVLERTPEADMSAAITGHLGPNAPAGQDGLIYMGIARRTPLGSSVRTEKYILPAEIAEAEAGSWGSDSLREWRQWKAAEQLLSCIRDELRT